MRRLLRFCGQVIALTIGVALVSSAWAALTDRIFGPGSFIVDVTASGGGKTTTFSLLADITKQGAMTATQNTDFGSLPDAATEILAAHCALWGAPGDDDALPRVDELHGAAHGSWKLNRQGGVSFVLLRHRFVKDTGRYIGWVRVSGTGRMDGSGDGMLEYLPAGDPLSAQPVCGVPLTFASRKIPNRLPAATASVETDPKAASAWDLLRGILSTVRSRA